MTVVRTSWIALFASLALLLSPMAQAATKAQQIKAFVASANLGNMLYGMQMQTGHYAEGEVTKKNQLMEIDTGVRKAVSLASGHPDLIKAIKSFYIADRAYLESTWSDFDQPMYVRKIKADQVQQRLKQSAAAIDLEINLAGNTL